MALAARWKQVNVPVLRRPADTWKTALWVEDDTTTEALAYDVESRWQLVVNSPADQTTAVNQLYGFPVITSGADTIVTTRNLLSAGLIDTNTARVQTGFDAAHTNDTTAYQWRYQYGLRDVQATFHGNLTTGAANWLYGDYALTPEQKARYAAEAERKRKRRLVAERRAHRLLVEHLSSEESDQLAEKGYFEVSSSSGRTYRIYRGHSRNVVELDKLGREVNRLCAYSRDGSAMPDEDHMLVQKLMLLTDEEGYRKVANHSRIYIPAAAAAA